MRLTTGVYDMSHNLAMVVMTDKATLLLATVTNNKVALCMTSSCAVVCCWQQCCSCMALLPLHVWLALANHYVYCWDCHPCSYNYRHINRSHTSEQSHRVIHVLARPWKLLLLEKRLCGLRLLSNWRSRRTVNYIYKHVTQTETDLSTLWMKMSTSESLRYISSQLEKTRSKESAG